MTDFLIKNYVVIIIISGMFLLGAVTGMFGVLTVLRKQALAGDALSHAALPGVVLAYILTQNKSMPVLLLGAAFSAFAAMGLISVIKKFSKVKNDAALALILSSFFGLGQLLLKLVQQQGSSSSAGLDSFIFGQAATMLVSDVLFIAVISLCVIFTLALLWKEIKLNLFDTVFFESLGFSRALMNFIMNFMTVTVVVVSIRAAGVILMSAMLISPAVAARQWSNKLFVNVLLSAALGAVSGVIGAVIGASKTNMPTGPVVIIALSIFLAVSVFFAPQKGIVSKALSRYRQKNKLKRAARNL